jgi:HEAT repeat protein
MKIALSLVMLGLIPFLAGCGGGFPDQPGRTTSPAPETKVPPPRADPAEDARQATVARPEADPMIGERTLSDWVNRLSNLEPATRTEAVRMLAIAAGETRGRIPGRLAAAAPEVQRFLLEEDPEARLSAAAVLSILDAEKYSVALLALLQDSDEAFRLRAANLLANNAPQTFLPAALPVLIMGLQRDDPTSRQTLTALGRVHPGRVKPALVAALEASNIRYLLPPTVVTVLDEIEAEAGHKAWVAVLLARLDDLNNVANRRAAVAALGDQEFKDYAVRKEFKETTVKALSKAMGDVDPDVRRQASQLLFLINPEAWRTRQLTRLKEGNEDARVEAVSHLISTRPDRAVWEVLIDVDTSSLEKAISTLQRPVSVSAKEQLLGILEERVLKSPDPAVRLKAVNRVAE